jgi:hypothetical protein
VRWGAVAIAILAVGVAIVLVAVNAGGSSASNEQPVGVGQLRAGSSAQLAQCSDWNEGTEEQKGVTVEDVREALNQANSGGPTPSLPSDRTYALFEDACSNDYAAGFRLYKIYARAAAFANLGSATSAP